jgi:PqqD family protein of HPr-rel-A system
VFRLAAAARRLVWRPWDDVYLVYQPSSAETHVFNETTAVILRCLEQEPLSVEALRDCAERSLAIVAHDRLSTEAVLFALGRLEELGLIEAL